MGGYRSLYWRRACNQWWRLQKRWLPMECGLTIGPTLIFAAFALPDWAFPHPSDEFLPAIYGIIASAALLAFIVVGSFVWALVDAPARYHRLEERKNSRLVGRIASLNQRVARLEEERRPRMFMIPCLEDQFQKDEPGYLLRVRNKGLDDLKDCHVRLEEIIWKTQLQDGRDYYKQLFKTDDIYFHWKGNSEEKRYTFSDEALCVIASRCGSLAGRDTYALSAIGVESENTKLMYEGPYFLVLQMAASNHDTVRRFYKLTPGRSRLDDGEWVEIDESELPAAEADD